jgi:hypothetical protein
MGRRAAWRRFLREKDGNEAWYMLYELGQTSSVSEPIPPILIS